MSAFLKEELARETVKRVLTFLEPTLDALVAAGILKRRCAVITVLNPTIPYHPDTSIEAAVLAQVTYGDDPVVGRFAAISMSKAEITWRTGRPSREVQALHPHLLMDTDTIYGGSVNLDGQIVAVSGVQDYYDETIALMVAALLKGMAMQARQALLDGKQVDFIGQAVRMALPVATPS